MFLDRHKITAIVNATADLPSKFEGDGIDYFRVPIYDDIEDAEKLETFLEEVTGFMGMYFILFCNYSDDSN